MEAHLCPDVEIPKIRDKLHLQLNWTGFKVIR